MLGAISLSDVIGDVRRKRRFAHGWPARDDDEIGGLQPAHLLIEVLEAAGDARKAAVALIGIGCHIDGIGECPAEGLETLAVFSGFGNLVKAVLGLLDPI